MGGVDIEIIRRRLRAATPGPWDDDVAMDPTVADLDLIVHAPCDLAALCDELEAVGDPVAAWRDSYEAFVDTVATCVEDALSALRDADSDDADRVARALGELTSLDGSVRHRRKMLDDGDLP